MTRFRQFVPTYKPMPKPGAIRELINRDREVVGLGIVYGVLPKERTILMQPLNIDEQGNVCRQEINQ
jgi:hypothetical protein